MQYDQTILVNRSHPVPEGFSEGIELVSTKVEDDNIILLEAETMQAFLALQQALGDMGLRIELYSGYRFFDRQRQIWDESVQKNGLEYTERYVAIPGCSEHQTGLAADLVLYGLNGQIITDGHAPEYEILFRHLHEFGFILRYPEGREAVTGIGYEPWHIRYVGNEAAKVIYENDLTLEEYTEMNSQP